MHKKKQKKTVIIKMATGGLMGQPPYIAKQDKEDNGINPYDVNTPESARQGLPSRLLSKKRTRFKKGGMLDRQHYSKGDEALRSIREFDIPDEPLDEAPAEGDIPGEKYAGGKSAKDKMIVEKIDRLEAQKTMTNDSSLVSRIDNEIKKLSSMVSTRITAAAGGYMDENQIAEETPLALSLGGTVDRKEYQAYAEGDMVEDESLLAPMGMEDDMMAETDTEMMAEDDMMEDDMDADGILDTSALSEEEETLLDEAMEMHPELEAIIPKIVATEFTEDELVEGPGDGTSDSIPALLSDGEFIFTAKAVKNLGVDTLRDMMAQAEADYDPGLNGQEEEDSLLA